ncbi:portal protein [Paenibacillus amylolyticus]|uniref:portal protein n=1 Tax=Paenibacillus amylolyticus TaxID=1451 RepID=UPI003D9982E4
MKDTTLDKLAGEMDKQYRDGLSYKRRMGFLDKWPEYERFKAGDQWPAATQRTKHLPRPVFNVIKMIETHKVATVMSEQIKMVYSAQEIVEDNQMDVDVGELFSRYSEATWERIKQDELNEEALDIAANTGTCVLHYYWDSGVKGGKAYPWIGEMEGEVLDPINVFFGNPQQRNVQKQNYIIISSRELVSSVKDYAKNNGVSQAMLGQIKPDKETTDQGYDMAKVELNDTSKVIVLTKYWKEDGKIMFAKTCCGITLKKPTDTGLSRYPVAVMQWERRKKSIFGIGDTEGLIPNQKAVNMLVAMQILSVQLTGWPKMVYKSQAIDPSKVTNAPGEMIEDRMPPGQGDGVKYLNPGAISSSAANLVEAILGYTRQMTGADEAATGSAPSAQLNATAIMLLQKAAAIPIESIKRRFYRLIEDVGRIWEDFFKVKYNLPRQVKLQDDDGEEYATMFDGSQYQDTELNLKIDVGPSSTYSESLVLSSLNDALNRGNITYEQFLKFAPRNVVPFRDRLMKELEEKKGIVGVIEQMIATMQPQEQEMFSSMPPEQQLQLIQQVMMQQQPQQGMPQSPSMQTELPAPQAMAPMGVY